MAKARINSGGQTEIKCPGCKTTHTLNTDPSRKPCWGFNGDFEKPTFTPSILERSGHYCDRATAASRSPFIQACPNEPGLKPCSR